MSIKNEPQNEQETMHLMLTRMITLAEFLVAPPDTTNTDAAAQIIVKKHISDESLYSESPSFPVTSTESSCEK